MTESLTVEASSDSLTSTDGGSDTDQPTTDAPAGTETPTGDGAAEQVESSGAGFLPVAGVLILIAALGVGSFLYRSRT